MNSYLLPFLVIISALLSACLVPFVRRVAVAWGAISLPGGRHVHRQPTPRLGGLAIAGSFLLLVIAILIFDPSLLKFVDHQILGLDRNLFGVLVGTLVLVVVGVWDDLKNINPGLKFFFQVIAAVIVVLFGVKIHWLSNPLGGPNIILGNWTYLLVPIWLVLMTNVMNWFDGVDGLTPGLSMIAAIAIMILSFDPIVNQPATALLAAIVAGATLGFLPFNWYPAKIFLGDSGSMFLGFMLGIFAIIAGAKFATAALVLGLPILDAGWVILRRLFTGQPVWRADQKHLHHRLLSAGLGPRATVIFHYLVAAGFGIIALTSSTQGKVRALLWLVIFMVLLGTILVFIDRRNHHATKIH